MTERAQRPTLEEVAAHAGVSRATVSRVINGSPKVSPDVRESVLSSVEVLGYVPNFAARSLVTQRTDSVAVVISEPDEMVFTDPVIASQVRGISAALRAAHKQLILIMVKANEDQRQVVHYLTSGHVDGIILLSLHAADELPTLLAGSTVPLVISGRPMEHPNLPYVDVDNPGGAGMAVRYLESIGRTRIATIAGPQDMSAGQDRLEGFEKARGEEPVIVAYGDFTRDSGRAAMARLLDENPDLDGVFAASDLMALGALRELRARGLRVPEDIAVVGFDDTETALLAEPPLTTIRQPIGEMGAALVRLLLSVVDGPAGGEPAELTSPVILQPELITRDSA